MTPVEGAVSGARAACGLVLVGRHSTLDRLQGARMIAQAGVELWARRNSPGARAPADTTTVYTLASAVDGLHGLSMLAFTTLPGHRRHAAGSAALALLFLAADVAVCRAVPPAQSAHHGLLMEV